MSYYVYAMMLGALGSLHCAGMCGPLALSLPLNNSSDSARWLGGLVYNLGRAVTYFFIGIVAGFIGYSFSFFGAQQIFSVAAGSIILIVLIFRKTRFIPADNILLSGIRKALGIRLKKPGTRSLFIFGLLNGLLPCGLVYMALAGALIMGRPLESGLFMASFGAGTIPMMWALIFFGHLFSQGLRYRLRRVYPVILGVMAFVLIIRGLGLNIPYLSPSVPTAAGRVVDCHK